MKTRIHVRLIRVALLAILCMSATPWAKIRADDGEALSSVRKSWLRYKGKRFNDYRELLHTEIEPKTRLDHLKALAAFARHGMGAEVTEAILTMMEEYDYSYIHRHLDEDVNGRAEDEPPSEIEVIAECERIVEEIMPVAVADLENWLRPEKRGACWFALVFLGDGGFTDAGAGALPAVLELTKSKNHIVAADALRALGKIGGKDKKAFDALLAGLQHKESNVRCSALEAIVALEPEIAVDAAPAVLKALEDSDPKVCFAAIDAWRFVSGSYSTMKANPDLRPKAVPMIVKLLRQNDGSLQEAAFKLLEDIGPDAREAVPVLRKLLNTANPEQQERIRKVLARIESK